MDTIIIPSKGGPSKTMINPHPSFDLTRRNSSFRVSPNLRKPTSVSPGPDNYRDGLSQPRNAVNLLNLFMAIKWKYNDSCMTLRRYCFVPSQTAEQHQQQNIKSAAK
jgi:hypothetical protein